jgi:uncharacterized protein involved in oxidation of intracellular sulfur
MKKTAWLLLLVVVFSAMLSGADKKFKLGIVVYSNDPETVWNAFRLANFSISQGDEVSVFLLGKGVECESLTKGGFDVKGQAKAFAGSGGLIFTCGTCLKIRNKQGTELCPVSNLSNLYRIIRESDRVVTF